MTSESRTGAWLGALVAILGLITSFAGGAALYNYGVVADETGISGWNPSLWIVLLAGLSTTVLGIAQCAKDRGTRRADWLGCGRLCGRRIRYSGLLLGVRPNGCGRTQLTGRPTREVECVSMRLTSAWLEGVDCETRNRSMVNASSEAISHSSGGNT